MSSTTDRLAVARNELSRADQKAGSLLSLALASLSAGLILGARGGLPLPVVVDLWGAVAVLIVAVVVLTLAIRPRLDGENGIAAWALGKFPEDDDEQALIWVSRVAIGKHHQIRYAITCIWIALSLASLAAVMTAVLATAVS
jgi:hypothetical protein